MTQLTTAIIASASDLLSFLLRGNMLEPDGKN
jgi:hypothetical protein